MNNSYYHVSDGIFYDSMRWLLHSGIRITDAPDRGAIYGWKNLGGSSSSSSHSLAYPFIYSEITGYAVTFFSWLYSELKTDESIQSAKLSADWIIKNMASSSASLLVAGQAQEDGFVGKGDISNQVYAFDNGVIIFGLLSLYKLTNDSILLAAAEKITNSLIQHFFYESSKVISSALLDTNFKPVLYGKGKWSTLPGPYHSKLALAFLELYRITNNNLYSKVAEALCNFAMTFQKPGGRFITNPDAENDTFLHPHLYACEGLIYAGINDQHNTNDYLNAGLKGLVWAMQQIKPNGGLPRRSTGEEGENIDEKEKEEQSDCMAQLLRLLIICDSDLLKKMLKGKDDDDDMMIDKSIELLHRRLLDFYISSGSDRGAFKYHLSLKSACSWCTMFSSQAIRLWSKRKRNELEQKQRKGKKENENIRWIDFYI